METFDRIGPSPFRPDGTTRDTNIYFPGGSILKVYGGSSYNNFKLRFDNDSNEGWWVGLVTLNLLIAELLYIRRDMEGFKDGIDLDVEVGRLPAEAWDDHPEEEDVEEDNEIF